MGFDITIELEYTRNVSSSFLTYIHNSFDVRIYHLRNNPRAIHS